MPFTSSFFDMMTFSHVCPVIKKVSRDNVMSASVNDPKQKGPKVWMKNIRRIIPRRKFLE